MKFKKFISAALSVLMLFPATAYADNISQIIGDGNNVTFIDVPANFWAKAEIDSFAQQGIVNGYTDGTFRPSETVTREEFCKLLISTFNQPLESPVTASFADVTTNRWSYPYVETCKNFLTGYTNPFGGLPSFHPQDVAQREDIAVALVRMMGYTDSDVRDASYVTRIFSDGSQVSPNLRGYVSIACEKGLMNGYPDGSFGPTKGITRAETVVLLGRATKQAVTNIEAELALSANVSYSKDGKTATVRIQTEEGASVSVDGNPVHMSQDYYNGYTGNYVYVFPMEGTKTFAITAAKAGKDRTIYANAQYTVGAPVLTINECPINVTEKVVTISGTIANQNGGAQLLINNETVATANSGTVTWSKKFTLKEGANEFKFVLINDAGKKVEDIRRITFTVKGPTLKINNCPTSVNTNTVTISGSMFDPNYNASLTINGTYVDSCTAKSEKNWSKSFTLAEGTNSFEIVLKNEANKSIREVRTVEYAVTGPQLTIFDYPATSTNKNVMISGTISDDNYPVMLEMNGRYVSHSSPSDGVKKWGYSVSLTEGTNTLEFVLTNDAGKQVKKTCTIEYTVSGPQLKINECPATSGSKNIRVSGTMYDANSNTTLTVNGKYLASNYYGGDEKGWSGTVELQEGTNTLEFVLTNGAGKKAKEVRTVEFTAAGPEIRILQCPTTSDSQDVTISGIITDPDYDATLTINNQYVSNSTAGSEKRWSKNVTLHDGENTFAFVLTNDKGKSVTETRTIIFSAGSPEILFYNCPETSMSADITLMGKIQGVSNNAKLFINDEQEYVNWHNEFSKDVTLNKGLNTFVFRVVNDYGKETTVTKTVMYGTPVEEGTETEEQDDSTIIYEGF